MRFKFETTALRQGIRLIQVIPDFRLCYIEGQNGVGKTLALHLLEIATGQQPYAAMSSAWKSLKDSIGQVRIEISGMTGAEPLTIWLTPDTWPDKPEPVDSRFGYAEQGNARLELGAVGAQIGVFRVAGDETFDTTIRSRIQIDAGRVERVRGRFEAALAVVDSRLGALDGRLAPISPERLKEQQSRSEALRLRVKQLQDDISAGATLRESLERALTASQRFRSVTEDLPGLKRREVELENMVGRSQSRLDELESRRQELQPVLNRQTELSKLIESAESLRNRRLTRLRTIEVELVRMARDLGVSPERAVLEAKQSAAKAELLSYEAQLQRLDRSVLVKEAANEVKGPLYRASLRGLDQEIIAEVQLAGNGKQPAAIDLKLAELSRGIDRRLATLDATEPAAETARLRALISRESAKLRLIQAALQQVSQRERAKELVDDAQAEVSRLAQRVSKTIAQEYRAVVGELQAVQDELRKAVVDQVGVRHQIELLSGGKSTSDLEQELLESLRRLGLTNAEGLDGLLATHDAKQRSLEDEVRQARGELSDTQTIISSLEHEIRPTLREFYSVADFAWLTSALPDWDELDSWTTDDLIAFIGRLHRASAKLRNDLADLRGTLDALQVALNAIADAVGKSDSAEDLSAHRFAAPVRRVMARRLEADLDRPEIRRALFGGGSLEEIDLIDLKVTWRDPEDNLQVRPFEAFSSGERAFAYTRARIESVANVAAHHKVVALDEFGAFLARDRLESLMEFLRNSVIGKLAEQVLLVLPLTMNYEEQTEITQGPLQNEYKRRAEEVAARGYFFVDDSTGD
jgi:hypothetical protein